MPLLQYYCENCKKNFDELVKRFDDTVYCPDCKKAAKRAYCGEMYSATGKSAKKCGGNCKTCGGCK
ncbi:MAG: zinc ribbon domain-containing protein [Clostridia bacterium]|nr:zinc ribbon domain-containing protein [Clostridia bacterium]MDE6356216.1 zinc ribbon domain-containing protein [Clostridia bacterium]